MKTIIKPPPEGGNNFFHCKEGERSKIFTETALKYNPNPIRGFIPLLSIPGMISLGGGLPSPTIFPITSFSFQTNMGTEIRLTDQELEKTLQYSESPGFSLLREELIRFQKRIHNPISDFDVCVVGGAQQGVSVVVNSLFNSNDTLLTESPTYPGSLCFFRTLTCKVMPVSCDQYGVNISELRDIYEHWDERNKDRCKPKGIYVIPTGQNPTGSTMTEERMKQLYQLACEFDFLILEDDPYYFLYYGPDTAPPIGSDEEKSWYPSKRRSLFSLDNQSRVIRFDSLSKVVASGLRIGFVSGPAVLTRQVELIIQASLLHTSGLSQMIVLKLLQDFGKDGWDLHTKKAALYYCRQRDMFIRLAEKYLKGIATWFTPTAGMFLWIKFIGIEDSSMLMKEKAKEAKILVLPGEPCFYDSCKTPYARMAFSVITEDQASEALQRINRIIKEN